MIETCNYTINHTIPEKSQIAEVLIVCDEYSVPSREQIHQYTEINSLNINYSIRFVWLGTPPVVPAYISKTHGNEDIEYIFDFMEHKEDVFVTLKCEEAEFIAFFFMEGELRIKDITIFKNTQITKAYPLRSIPGMSRMGRLEKFIKDGLH